MAASKKRSDAMPSEALPCVAPQNGAPAAPEPPAPFPADLPRSFLRSFLQNTRDMAFIKDVHFVYLGASQAFAETAGCASPAEVVGKTDFELFSDAALAKRYRDDDERMLRLDAPLSEYVEPIPARDGRPRYAATSKYILRDESGAPAAICGISRDVTWEYRARLDYDREMRVLFELPDDTLCAVLFDVTEWRVVEYKCRDAKNRLVQRYDTVDAFVENAKQSVAEGDEARAFFAGFSQQYVQSVYDSGRRLVSFEYVRRMPDGRARRVRERMYLLSDPLSGHLSAFFTFHALTGRPRAQTVPAELAGREDLLKLLDENTSVGVLCVTAADGRFPLYYLNDSLLALSGYTREAFTERFGDDLLKLLAPEDAANAAKQLSTIRSGGGEGTFHFHVTGADGRSIWLSDTVRYMQLSDGKEIFFGIVTDITDIKSQQESAEQRAESLARQRDEISRSADSDTMTGLLNREATMRKIGAFLESDGARGFHALFMIDIDNFKSVNDTLGHQTGDQTLIALAAAIRECFRDTDIVGRIGGDEFFAFMKRAQRESDVRRKAQELIDALRHVYVSGTKAVELSGSIGVSLYRGDGKRLSELYFEADSALYQAKAMGKNCYALADPQTRYATDALYSPPTSLGAFSIRSLLDNIGGGIGIFHGDADGHVVPLYCNESLLHLMGGLTIEQYMDVYGKNAFAGVHPGDLPEVAAAFDAARLSGESFRRTYRVRGADKLYLWVSAVGNFVSHGDGSYDFYAVYTDATQQVQEQAELEKQFRSFQSFRRLAEKNTVGSFQMNLSANWCGAGESATPSMLALQRAGTVDGFFAACQARFVNDDELARYQELFSRRCLLDVFADGQTSVTFEHRFCVEPGRAVWMRSVIEMMENPKTHDVEALTYAVDIDQEKTMQRTVDKLLRADYRFLGLIHAKTGILTVCGSGADAAFEASYVAGSRFDDVMPAMLRGFVEDAYYEESLRALRCAQIVAALTQHEPYSCLYPAQRGAQGAGVYRFSSSYLDETKTIILLTVTDVTDAVSSERDPLSGLLNRQGFYRRARAHIDEAPDTRYKLLRFDIDNFKVFNDAMGVAKGDELLAGIGAALRDACAESGAPCGRLEADHFVLLANAEDTEVEEMLLGRLNEFFRSYTEAYRLSMHLGVYPVEEPSAELSLMCDRALLALRAVKGSYAQRIGWYDDSLREKLLEEQALSDEMASALASGQFEIYLQPQINYEDGSLIGAEALVRWNHPVRGIIGPNLFIPLFERNGFITALDEYVWEQCCMHLRKWMDDAKRFVPIAVSVNISRIDIYNPKLCDTLKGLVAKYGLPPSMLKLEITESAYMQSPEQLISAVRILREAGFTIEMDDFGAGYSSLNTLKDVPVDILKLDVKFLSRGEDDARGGSILSSVIRMAHWLKIPVIAEGVETKTQADYLKSLSCFYMQGYFFSKPMPLAEFEPLLLRSRVAASDRYTGVDLNGVAAFWDPSAQTALLFNSFVGGAAVMEYRAGNAEILRANDMFYSQLETTRAEYLDKQRHTLERFAGAHRAAFRAMLERAAATGLETECEVQSLPHAPGGRGYWLHIRVKLLAQNADSGLFYVSVENVTERKLMEEQLRLSKEAMQLAISRTGRVVFHFDVPTQSVALPASYAHRHGISASVTDIAACSQAVMPEDREKYENFYARITAGEKTGALLYRAVNMGGSYSWEQADFVTVFSDGGAPISAVVTVSDVTAQKEQEAENARMALLIRHSGVCVVDYDLLTDTLQYKTCEAGLAPAGATVSRYLSHTGRGASRVDPAFRAAVRAFVKRAGESAPGSAAFELRADLWGSGMRWARLDYVSLGDLTGRVYRIVGQISDIQREKDDAALIARLNETLSVKDAAYTYSNAVVERVFSLLYDTGANQKTIGTVLAVLGRQYGLSRVYVLEDDSAHTACSCTFEWCAEGVPPQAKNRQSVSYRDSLGKGYRNSFDERGVFFCADTAALPKERRDILDALGIRSFLQCAILDDGVYSGYIGFDENSPQRVWTEEQLGTLLLVSRILGAFITKLRKGERAAFSDDFRAELRKKLERQARALRALYDTIPCGILQYSVGADGTRSQVSCNCACFTLFGYESERDYLRAVLARRDIERVHPDDIALVREKLAALKPGAADVEYTHRLLLPSGATRKLRAQLRRVESGADESTVYAVFFDVTE